jgi:hypothetical protein
MIYANQFREAKYLQTVIGRDKVILARLALQGGDGPGLLNM